MPVRRSLLLSVCALSACVVDGVAIVAISSGAERGSEEDASEWDGELDGGEGSARDDLARDRDLGGDGRQEPLCGIRSDGLDGALPCGSYETSQVIELETAWSWTGPDGESSVMTTPLVANLNDDNGDGWVDLCDVPDVVVAAVALPYDKSSAWPAGHLYILDGETGVPSQRIETGIDAGVNPALADLDGDGVPEIIALQAMQPASAYTLVSRRLVAFRSDGAVLWIGAYEQISRGGGALAVADLDGDRQPEILAPEYVADASGQLLWSIDDPPLSYSMPLAVDLDLDGTLEVLFGGSAYAHDGEWLFEVDGAQRNRGSVATANFDDDPYPELYVQQDGEHGVFEHDGSLLAACPVGSQVPGAAGYPATIEDLDGDGRAELIFSYADGFFVLHVNNGECTTRWTKKVDAVDGLSSSTVFDFLGDGDAEVVHADRSALRLFGADGSLLFSLPRSARESIATPLVADVDGDGAAEILVTASASVGVATGSASTVRMLQNVDDRFAPTRRVWNQHAYHRGSVNEIAAMPPAASGDASGDLLSDDGFRVNPRIEVQGPCIPADLR